MMIFSEIFNPNRFVAAIRFTMMPTILAFVICILFANWKEKSSIIIDYSYLVIVGIITVISVMTSNIVGWTANATAFLIYLFLFILMTRCELSQKGIKNLYRFYLVLSLIICSQIFINYALSSSISFGRVSFKWMGVLKDQNIVSAFVGFGAVLSLISYLYKRNNLCLFIFLYIVFAMMLLGSRGGMMSCMISCSVMMIKWLSDKGTSLRKIIVIALSFIFVATLVVFFSGSESFSRVLNLDNYKTDGRLSLWKYAMQAFFNKPLIGSGYDSGTYYSSQYWNLGAPTHNSYIDLITSVGLLGSFAYLVFVIRRWRVPKESRLYILAVAISLLLPLFFINGYGTITFMMPCVLVTVISAYCKNNSFTDLIL